jgi:hypothetical protein
MADQQDGKKKGKEAGNSELGEKKRNSSSSSESDDDEDEDAVKVQSTQDGAQGLESADVVVGGEKVKTDKKLSEKEKKKLAQKEAKRKRDEMVGKMTKATEDGLGAFADLMERLNK